MQFKVRENAFAQCQLSSSINVVWKADLAPPANRQCGKRLHHTRDILRVQLTMSRTHLPPRVHPTLSKASPALHQTPEVLPWLRRHRHHRPRKSSADDGYSATQRHQRRVRGRIGGTISLFGASSLLYNGCSRCQWCGRCECKRFGRRGSRSI